MGLFDLPAPLLATMDDWLAVLLPLAARLVVWAAFGAVLSMETYRLASPQRRIAEAKAAADDARRQLADFDGEFEEAWPLMRAMLSASLRRLALAFPAAIAAAVPFIVLIVWLDNGHGRTYPPAGATAGVSVPAPFEGRWVSGAIPSAEILDSDGRLVTRVAVIHPVPVIHKRQWWNVLVGNPAGYLHDDLPFDKVELRLPRPEVLTVGPAWLRGWETVFLAASVIFAFAFKTARRIT